jgi:hypothetical protein
MGSLCLFNLLYQTIKLLVLLLHLSLNLLYVITCLLDLVKFFLDWLLVEVREGDHNAHIGLSQFFEHASQDGIESGTPKVWKIFLSFYVFELFYKLISESVYPADKLIADIDKIWANVQLPFFHEIHLSWISLDDLCCLGLNSI